MLGNKKKPIVLTLVTILFALFVAGVAVFTMNKPSVVQDSAAKEEETVASQKSGCPWVGSNASPQEKVSQVVAQMTLDEKIAMLGLEKDKYENVAPAIPRLCIPRLILQDGPAGVAGGFRGVTQLPAPIVVAASWDPAVAAQYGSIQGDESRGKGIMVVQGPNVNIARVPENGRSFEAYGEDPYLVSQMAVANIKAIQATGEMANVKHFAGNNQESQRHYINDVVSERALREIYFPAFRAAVEDADAATAMCAYNKINGPYSCSNSFLMTEVLRNEWGFEGFIRSDLGAVHNVAASYNAGMDQAKPKVNDELKAAVKDGQVPMSRIDDAVGRILFMMFRYDFIDHPPKGTPGTEVTSPQHAESARSIAEKGTVLLKNANDILPLNIDKLKSIAVIGTDGDSAPLTAGTGSSHVKPPYVVSPYKGIQSRAGSGVKVTYIQGNNSKAAADAAQKADVAIVFAKAEAGEGKDRPGLLLPDNQNEMISAVAEANPNVIVVLHTGNPVAMPWLDQVKGVIEAWYAGQEDGNAIAAVLFGDVNPSGKLPVSFPKSEADTPAHTTPQWPGTDGNVQYSEGLLVGYRWYDAQKKEPLFPFGFGLSYTTFKVDHLQVGPRVLDPNGQVTVSADVTNTGNWAGEEVVQLYVGMPAEADEPPKQLKGFRKVSLNPGQTEKVTFTLTPEDLSYWNSKAHTWAASVGEYKIMVGTSSRDIAATDTVRVEKAIGPQYVKTSIPPVVNQGTSVTVTTTFTNESDYEANKVELKLTAPEEWTVQSMGKASFDSVPAGGSVSAEWKVNVPTAAKEGDYPVSGSAAYESPDGGSDCSDAPIVSVPYKSIANAFNNVGITDDTDHTPGNFDGSGNSYSATSLAKKGISPGSRVESGGVNFTWPDVPAGKLDNVVMEGQVIRLTGSGEKLGILGAAVGDTFSGTGTIYFADGSSQSFTITFPDWFSSNPSPGGNLVALANLNRTNKKPQRQVSLFAAYVQLKPGQKVQYVKLPFSENIHAFDMAIK